jgi:hypothetical protein
MNPIDARLTMERMPSVPNMMSDEEADAASCMRLSHVVVLSAPDRLCPSIRLHLEDLALWAQVFVGAACEGPVLGAGEERSNEHACMYVLTNAYDAERLVAAWEGFGESHTTCRGEGLDRFGRVVGFVFGSWSADASHVIRNGSIVHPYRSQED